jgi:ATP-dependent RNA helicase DDX31/DBP7
LRDLKGLHPQALAPLEQYIDNEELLSCDLNQADPNGFELILAGITHSFWLRDFEKAKRMADMFTYANKNKDRLLFNHVMLNFYVGLTACYFGRAKQDSSWKVEVEKASNLIELSFNHSTWNFENKLLLLKAESHYTKGEANEAAKCYEASIKSARVHKFVHEEAVACELAGYFFKEQGDETKSCNMFIQARDAYIKWGATGKANLLPLWHPLV